MDSIADNIGLLIPIIICVVLSAYFSATETAFSSLNRIRIKNMAQDGNKRAELVLRLSEEYDKLISTILIGNNIVNILGTTLSTVFFVKILPLQGATVSTIVMTVTILIFGEISPKSLAKDAPERFAMFSAPILNVLLTLLSPLNFLFSQWKRLLTSIFKVEDDRGITEEELLTLVEEAQDDQGITEEEGELIRNAIEFNDMDVIDVFTPRVDVVAIEDNETKEQIALVFQESGYSRLPVYHETIDNITGIILQKDFYNEVLFGGKPIESIIHDPLFITSSMKISKLMRVLQESQSHLAVITDEYGGTVGIVTLEDILEELVGEIWDEHDEIINEIEQKPDGSYTVNCSAHLDDLFEELGLDDVPDITTVSGWVIEQFGRIPNEGDQFTYRDLTVTVTETDFQRVVGISIVRSQAPAE